MLRYAHFLTTRVAVRGRGGRGSSVLRCSRLMGGATGARGPQGSQRGAFILFEGVDRCGKTTQSRRLVEHLRAAGVCPKCGLWDAGFQLEPSLKICRPSKTFRSMLTWLPLCTCEDTFP